MKPKFKAKVEGNIISFYRKDLLAEYMKNFDGKDIAVSFSKWSEIRTEQQNRYLHGVIFKMISKETGMTLKEAKNEVKIKIKFYDKIEQDGEIFKVLKETSSLNKIEFNKLVSECRIWAKGFLNIYIPLPDEIEIDDLYFYDQ